MLIWESYVNTTIPCQEERRQTHQSDQVEQTQFITQRTRQVVTNWKYTKTHEKRVPPASK